MVGIKHLYRLFRKNSTSIFIAVLLSCCFLAYIGLQSVLHESEVQTKLAEQNLQSALKFAVRQVEDKTVRQLTAMLQNVSSIRGSISTACDSLHAIAQRHGCIKTIFLVDRNERIIFPRAFPRRHARSPSFGPLQKQMQTAEQLEADGRHADAVALYRSVYQEKLSAQSLANLLCRIARCEQRLGNTAQAEVCYRRILSNDRMHVNGDPLAPIIVASYGLIELEEQRSRAQEEILLTLFRSLLDRFDSFDREQFEYYIDWVKERMKLFSGDSAIAEVIHRFEGRLTRVHEESNDAEFIETEVLPRIRLHPSFNYGAIHIDGIPDSNGNETAFYAVRKTDDAENVRFVGCVFRAEMFLDFIRKIAESQEIEDGVRLAIAESESQAPDDYPLFTSGFERFRELFPERRLAMTFESRNPVESISSANLTVYYTIILAILAFALGGTATLIREMRREQELTRMKADFIANVSHEIKTPIATIRALTENLNEGWVLDAEKQKQYFKLIAQESERSSFLISNILDFSQIESGMKNYHFEVVSVEDVIIRAIDRFKQFRHNKSISFDEVITQGLPVVRADANALEQAVLNLLDNAVKYSHDTCRIVLSAQSDTCWVTVSVQDNGIGIPGSELKHVFRKFYRGHDNDALKATGSGIGLSIVKEIIEAHRGKIAVDSAVGSGSTFTIHLPIHRAM